MEITVIHKADPELLAKLDLFIAAVGNIRTGISLPEHLFQPTPSPEQKIAKKAGRPAKDKEPEPPAAPAAPALPETATTLPDYDSIKTELRDLMTKGMSIDQQNKNKDMRQKMKDIFIGLDEQCDGKLSGLPDEKLEQALALVRQLITPVK